MNITKNIVPWALAACLVLSLHAQESASQALTLEDCIRTAMEHNPLILSSLQQYQASQARISQAKAFSQPTLNWDSDLQENLFDFNNAGEWYLGISQSLEFPGKQYVRGKIAGKESEELAQDIDLLKLDIVFQVKQAFYSLLHAQEKLNYVQQDLELSQEFLKNAQHKFEAGDVARVEVLRAQVEVSKAENRMRAAHSDERLAKAFLNYLMARRKYQPLEITGQLKTKPISLDIDNLKSLALSFRPEIKRLDLSLDKVNLQKKYAQMSYLPDFELGLNRHKVTGEGKWWDVTLSLTVPLFFWQPVKGEIAEAQANIRALQKESDHVQNTISLEVEDAYLSAVATADQIGLFEDDILAQAEEVYNMFLFSYQEGEIGGIELIEARRTLIESRTAYADALLNYRASIAALEKSVGQSLEGENNE
jgi:cobalt-zinc-cadmium efflux system outer membrane protein